MRPFIFIAMKTFVHLMIRSLVLSVALALSAFSSRAETAAELADKIAQLAEHEPIASTIDTRLRAAEILMPADPARSRRFLSQGLSLLRSSPQVQRTYGMAASLMFLDPANAERALLAGPDRVNEYRLILRYQRQWETIATELPQGRKQAETFRRALRDPDATRHAELFQLARPVLNDLGEVDATEAASLFLEVAAAAQAAGSNTEVFPHLGGLLTSFGIVLPARAGAVRDALVLLLPVVRDLHFASDLAAEGGAKFPAASGIETHSARDTILFRFGVLLHALAPEAYADSRSLFTPWNSAIITITSPQDAAKAISPAANPLLTPTDSLAAVQRLSSGAAKANAYAGIAGRSDIAVAQRADLADRALKEIATISSSADALPALANLLDVIRRWHPDADLARRALSDYLKFVQRGGQNPDDYFFLAQAESDLHVTLDSEDPILLAKRAVLQLQGLPEVQPIFLASGGHSLRPDGRGPYRESDEHTTVHAASYGVVLCTEVMTCSTLPEHPEPRPDNRAMLLDLNQPLAGTPAIPRGVIRSTEVNFGAFWGQDNKKNWVVNGIERPAIRQLHDIPPGKTVMSDRTEIRFFIGGVQHILQFGPWTTGQYQSAQGSLNGNGTTRAMLTRKSATSWAVRSSPRSIGRLWDNHDSAHPVDLGLYYFSFDVEFAQVPVH